MKKSVTPVLVQMQRKKIIITQGDPASIGPEVVAAALRADDLPNDCDFHVLPIVGNHTLGVPTRESAQSALEALETAAKMLNQNQADAVVTAPVAKKNLQEIGFPFPGQTEFFSHRLGEKNIAMCLTGKSLTVGLCTIHIPLADVAKNLTTSEIIRVGLLLENFLLMKKISKPRIAVCGLNPHAGENGAFGNEEQTIISPAIIELQKSSHSVFSGPHVPDAIFRDAAAGQYDAVLCMYHDQGLIPLKLLDFDHAVNVTLGLPKPRVSPDHGTAFSIAGKGIANHTSMLQAIKLAAQMVR